MDTFVSNKRCSLMCIWCGSLVDCHQFTPGQMLRWLCRAFSDFA